MTTTEEPDQEPEAPQLVRPYVITNGRSLVDDHEFSLITLITVAENCPAIGHLDPEKRRLVELCSGGTSRSPRSRVTPSCPSALSASCSPISPMRDTSTRANPFRGPSVSNDAYLRRC